jgi:hypothetical protein
MAHLRTVSYSVSALLLALNPFLPIFAHPPSEFSDSETTLETVTVEPPVGDPLDETSSASQNTVHKEDIERRPLLRTGELAEVVPGLIATQHSGGGKANQFFCAGSTWITAPISRPNTTACR